MDKADSCLAVPQPPTPATRLLIACTSSVYISERDLGNALVVGSSLSVLGFIWGWFEFLSWNLGRPPAALVAARTESPNGPRRGPTDRGYQNAPSWLPSTLMLLLTAVCSCVIIYSTVTGYYQARGDAAIQLFADCYVGIAAIYHCQHLIFLIIRVEAPASLSRKMLFELAIWSAATAFAMWVSSNSITLYPSQTGVLASDAGAFCVLLMMSRRFQQAGHGEQVISNWMEYHALLLNFIFRTSVLSTSPMELMVAMILYAFLNLISLWDIGRASASAYSTGSVETTESDH